MGRFRPPLDQKVTGSGRGDRVSADGGDGKNERTPAGREDFLPAILAAALFIPLFVFRRIGPFDFWWWMSAAIVVLIALGAALDSEYPDSIHRDLRHGAVRKTALGLLFAAILYGVFFAGNMFSRAIFPFAGPGIGLVYGFKSGASTARIVLLMALLIGPGEELFWRAYLQRRWAARFGPWGGFAAAAALYTIVHAASGNVMLVLAAAVCGVFWGWLYLKTGSVLLVAVSHTAWDLAVFVIFPFRG